MKLKGNIEGEKRGALFHALDIDDEAISIYLYIVNTTTNNNTTSTPLN